MKLLTKANRKALPTLYKTEPLSDNERMAVVKFFAPWSNWTWYAIEFDGEDTFFGLVAGQDVEFGYFSLAELSRVVGRWGLKIERDRYFQPTTIAKTRETETKARGDS